MEIGGFVQHDKIQAEAAQGVWMVAAADHDHTAVTELKAVQGFVFVHRDLGQGVLEIAPDFTGHAVGGTDPPAEAMLKRALNQGDLAQFRLPEASPAGYHFEALLGRQDGLLSRMGRYKVYAQG